MSPLATSAASFTASWLRVIDRKTSSLAQCACPIPDRLYKPLNRLPTALQHATLRLRSAYLSHIRLPSLATVKKARLHIYRPPRWGSEIILGPSYSCVHSRQMQKFHVQHVSVRGQATTTRVPLEKVPYLANSLSRSLDARFPAGCSTRRSHNTGGSKREAAESYDCTDISTSVRIPLRMGEKEMGLSEKQIVLGKITCRAASY